MNVPGWTPEQGVDPTGAAVPMAGVHDAASACAETGQAMDDRNATTARTTATGGDNG